MGLALGRSRRGAGKELAERLFNLMGKFDEFEMVLQGLQSVLGGASRKELREASRYFDFVELHNKCMEYMDELETIMAIIVEKMYMRDVERKLLRELKKNMREEGGEP